VAATLAENHDIASVEVRDMPIPTPSEAASNNLEEEEDQATQSSRVRAKLRGKGGRRKTYLSEDQKEEVIEFLIRNDGLYDKKRELWQQPNKKNELWQELGRTIGQDWKDFFVTWYKTQRRRLGRLKVLASKSGSGSLAENWKETDLEFWNRWQFLQPHINTQSQESVVSVSNIYECNLCFNLIH